MDKIDTAKYLQRVITVSWIALIVCFIIKLFGGNLFEIVCTNENFIKVCKYADTHLWAYYSIGAVYCFISLYFFILAILQRTKYKKWELCLADGSTKDEVGEYIKEHYGNDSRIVYERLAENKGIAGNTNASLAMATGEFVMLSDHDDVLELNALYEIVSAINKDKNICFSSIIIRWK